MSDLPVRGAAVRELALRLPPKRMAPMRAGRPLKRWRWVGVFRPDVMLCIGDARVAGIRQRWWAVALPDGTLVEGSGGLGVHLDRVDRNVEIELNLREGDGVEVVSPHGRSWVWTRKQAGVPVGGLVRVAGRTIELDGDCGFVDESAGYHARHTAWKWSAGIGRAADGRAVAWNLVDGVHDTLENSERTLWIDGAAQEVPPQEFAADLSQVGGLRFREWSARESNRNLLVMRNRYRQPFGEFSGTLPGGLALAEGWGVMEEHDVLW